MSLKLLIQLSNNAVIIGAFALALADLARRPRDHFRLRRYAGRAMAPAWCALALGTVASVCLFPGGKGYWSLFFQFSVLPAAGLLMGHFFLEAGSIQVWRGGLRGRGFGWLRPPRRWREILPLRPLAAGIAAVNGLTVGLYFLAARAVSIQPAPEFQTFQESFGYARHALTALILTQLLIAPFFEETLYRHYLQSRLARWFERRGIHWGWAAALTSALWAMGHAGLLHPEWAKFAQIFSAGLVLGWLQRRWGVALAIAVHLSLNIGVIVVFAWLV